MNQYRLLWTGISRSKRIKNVSGPRWFRLACHLVYTWLLPWADDDGRLLGDPLYILANIIPNEGLSITEIEKILIELDKVRLIEWYQVDGEKFIQVYGWEEHQRIRKDRYKPSIYPAWQPHDNQVTTEGKPDGTLSPTPTPLPTPSGSPIHSHMCDRFAQFWKAYPKKKSKGQAEKAFNKINPDEQLLAIMIAKIERATKSEDWIKEGGKYIPYPASWLNAKGWEDEDMEPDNFDGVVSDTTRRNIRVLEKWRPPS